MKVSKLIKVLGREIEEKRLTRDELLERVLTLSGDIRELDSQRETVIALESRFSPKARETVIAKIEEVPPSITPASIEPDKLDVESEAQPATSVQVSWPIGPHYQRQYNATTRQAWARYKLGTADWYLSTLQEIENNAGKLDRLLGVEMAIDGTIQALCATFDAVVFAFLSTVESGLHLPSVERTPAHLADWTSLLNRAATCEFELLAEPLLAEALSMDDPEAPKGWLAQLQLLGERSSQHDVLIRHMPVGGAASIVCIDVPGVGPQSPLPYLTGIRDRAHELVDALFEDQELFRQALASSVHHQSASVSNELPNLLRRAGVTSGD
jgi:hypothetical protein